MRNIGNKIGLACLLAGNAMTQSAFAENCNFIYNGGCTSSCGQKAGQAAVKETLTCSACSISCWSFRAASADVNNTGTFDQAEGAAYSSPEIPNHNLANPLRVDPSMLFSIAQVNPLAAIALASLGSKSAPDTFSLISGRMSIASRPTPATVTLRTQNASEADQIRTLQPLTDGRHHLEVVWNGIRQDPHTLIMHFETHELDSSNVPVAESDTDIEVTVKDGDVPHAVSWKVR